MNTKLLSFMTRFSLLAIALSLPLLSGCFSKQSEVASAKYFQNSTAGSNTGSSGEFGTKPEDDIPTATGVAAMVNFEQVANAMSVATSVQRDNAINNFVAANITNFLGTGTYREVSPVSVNSMIQLAGLYCQKAISRELAITNTQQRALFGMINFAAAANQSQLSGAVREQLCQSYADNFWQRSASVAECNVINQTLDEVLLGQAASQTQLRNALLASCASALTSIQTLGL